MKVEVNLPQDIVDWLTLNSRGLSQESLILVIIRAHVESQKMFQGLTENDWLSIKRHEAAKSVSERLEEIQQRPELHRHNFEGLQECCMVDGSFDPMLMEAHPELGRNGGQKCDVVDGPCSCGGWHSKSS